MKASKAVTIGYNEPKTTASETNPLVVATPNNKFAIKSAPPIAIKIGRSFQFAADKAATDAWKTILTADFVSLSAATLLYVLAIGPIRGFALALGVATVFDLFFTRLYTRNTVPFVSNLTSSSRGFFPIKMKDLLND